ncbi:MAG: cyclic nucleotide-binding domain-containing protein [Verrucomicrobiota bacterium]
MKSTLELCDGLPERKFEEGEEILVENHKGPSLFVLKEGAVEILKQDTQVNVVSSPGSIFGEVSVLLGRAHMATVRTLKPSSFFFIEDAQAFLQNNPEVNLHIARLLALRLNSVTTYLVDLKQQFDSREDHLGMVDEVLESILHHHENQEG